VVEYNLQVPLLSVVTITYNYFLGLRATIESLRSHDIDWIFIDGSTNEEDRNRNSSLLADLSVTLIQEKDDGRFDAMNKGLSLAKGDLVVFLNGGDKFASFDTPALIIESYLRNNWEWAVGQTLAVDKYGNPQWNWPVPKHNSLKLRLGVNSYCHQSTVYKTASLRSVGGFYSSSLYSDWQVSLQLSKRIRPYIDERLWAHFLINGVSANQTIDYWEFESHRLREHVGLEICRSKYLDKLLQKLAACFISSTRGQLLRPDLVKRHRV
jgi:glycosyltransferase involved in cell wall biosynthesis